MTVYMIKRATGNERLTKLHENVERVRIEPTDDARSSASEICYVLEMADGTASYGYYEWECKLQNSGNAETGWAKVSREMLAAFPFRFSFIRCANLDGQEYWLYCDTEDNNKTVCLPVQYGEG